MRTRRRWPWVVLGTLCLAAVLGLALGTGVVLRGRSFGAPLVVDPAARPTFIVATAPRPSPSEPSGSPGSPVPSVLPVNAQPSDEEYTVAAGDTLRSIAERLYGDSAQWARIYEVNRATIGPDPDTISAGTRLRIPRP